MSLRFTESFHKIAAKLEHKKNNSGGKAFAITSVSENEGKSTCAANIAVSLAARGNKVLLIDLDFKKPALYKIFSEESLEDLDPNESLSRETEFTDFSFRKLKKTNLSLALVTKANTLNKKLISDSGVSVLINKIRPEYDFIIVDTAPMAADSSVTDIINMVDETILVIRTDTVNVNVLNDSIATISKISSNLAGCILNDVYMSSIPFSITGDDESSGYGRYGYGRYSYYGHYGRNTIPKNSDQNKVKE